MSKSVAIVRQRNLCTACGTCQAVCPAGAVRIVRNTAGFLVPEVDGAKCTSCGLCLRACPGVGLPRKLTEEYQDIFTGMVLGAWVGRATDESLWKNGQSGGVASALLLYLLDKCLVDGAIVNGFDRTNRRPEVRIAKNKEELLAAQGSWYAQSAVNTVAVGEGGSRMAAVVLGCQAEGVMLTRLRAKGIETPEFLIGLVCAGNHSGLIIDDLVKQSGMKHSEVSEFRFRDKSAGGWPGNVTVTAQNSRAVLDKSKRIELKDCYGNYRCQCCFDQMNLFADVVLGDPWGIEDGRERGGRSIMLARTEKGSEIIKGALQDGYVTAEPVSEGAVMKGQTVSSRLVPQFFALRRIAQEEELPFPTYGFNEENQAPVDEKKTRLYRESMRYKFALQKLDTTDGVNNAVTRMKAKIRRRAIPGKLAAIPRRVLGKVYRLLLKQKGAAR